MPGSSSTIRTQGVVIKEYDLTSRREPLIYIPGGMSTVSIT